MKSLIDKKIRYKFNTKEGIATENLIIKDIDTINGITFIKVSFDNREKYKEISNLYHRFFIYKTVETFLKFCLIKNFSLTVEGISC